ncbi:hypothetical protein ABFT80_21370 [Mesorhizobium sp. SB112]|uniref:hypothetical protein n=1 Tax=Mesorhizobium sp. SB112 TaxID=3151853 RepID=UPI003263BA26
MRFVLSGAAALAALAASVKAEPEYDRKLERAVMEIVARKMGDIRGGFEHGRAPEFVIIRNPLSEEDVWRGVLHAKRPVRENNEIAENNLNLRITSF